LGRAFILAAQVSASKHSLTDHLDVVTSSVLDCCARNILETVHCYGDVFHSSRYMAMASGISKVLMSRPTLHLNTVIDVAKEFRVSIEVVPAGTRGNVLVCCKGLGVPLHP
jgi:hypothetical protein